MIRKVIIIGKQKLVVIKKYRPTKYVFYVVDFNLF